MDLPYNVMWSTNQKYHRSSTCAFQKSKLKWYHLEQSWLGSVRARWKWPCAQSTFGKLAELHLDGSNPAKDRRGTLSTDWAKFTRVWSQTTGDTSLERRFTLARTPKLSFHRTSQNCGLNHQIFWAHLKIPGISSRRVIPTHALHNQALRLKDFQHEVEDSTQPEWWFRQQDA